MTKKDEELGTLQRLIERLGEQAGVLGELHRIAAAIEARYLLFSKRMLFAITLGAMLIVGALAVNAVLVAQVRSAQADAESAAQLARDEARNVRTLARENRLLIDRLQAVAETAVARGRAVDLAQCAEIEMLKKPIRQVLRGAGGDRYLALFKPRTCRIPPIDTAP